MASVTNNAPANGIYPVGTTTVTWTVTDVHGNVNTATQTVTVIDNEQPTIAAPAYVTVNNDATKCGATVVLPVPATADNCGIQSVTSTAPANGFYNYGVTTVTWTVTDIHGNANTVSQTVTVNDNEKPVIVVPANQVFCANTGGNTQYTIPVTTATDNCGILSVKYAITGATTRTGNNGTVNGMFNIGTSTVTFTVTDEQ